MSNIVIVGAGDLGQQFRHMIENYSDDKVIGWIDDTKNKDEEIHGKNVIGDINDLLSIKSKITVALAIGYKHSQFKVNLIEKIKQNKYIKLYTFIHPTAFVDKTAIIEPGVFIYPNATIDMRVVLKSGVIINNAGIISHDSLINEGVFIAPNVTISGYVNIGKGCFVGAGSIIKDSITIGNYNTFGSGCNIFKNILDEGGIYITKSKLIKIKHYCPTKT